MEDVVEDTEKYEKPTLKTPPPPETVFLDLDAVLFAAASAGEKVVYTAKTPDGQSLGSFNKAADYKGWLEECEFMGFDPQFDYEGDLEDVERVTTHETGDFDECVKAFHSITEDWIKRSGCKKYVGYVSKASGEKNFRYDVASLKPYKGGRKDVRKPHYLEELRKYVTQLDWVKVGRGSVEVDDIVCAKSQKMGWRGCVAARDKDSLGVVNTHTFSPDEMDKPQFSSRKVLGTLTINDKGKVVGKGTLFWLYQTLAGDKVDGIQGCKNIGSNKAYNLLSEFSGVDAKYLKDALRVICEAYKKNYGGVCEYKHCTTGEVVTASCYDLVCEMSELVYMKKSLKDRCFWLPIIREIEEEVEDGREDKSGVEAF